MFENEFIPGAKRNLSWNKTKEEKEEEEDAEK